MQLPMYCRRIWWKHFSAKAVKVASMQSSTGQKKFSPMRGGARGEIGKNFYVYGTLNHSFTAQGHCNREMHGNTVSLNAVDKL